MSALTEAPTSCYEPRVIVHSEVIQVKTSGQGLVDVTARVAEVVKKSSVTSGLCHVFLQHTSASLIIQENADGAVQRDLERFLEKLVPESTNWEHDDEGPDDMPAHVKAALTKTSELVPVGEGKLLLGTWQAIYLWEHRKRPHERRLVVHLQGQ